ncbi:cyclic nucleotide-binding domain-containing protein [Desulfovibrio sp. JC022]|uniref:cyclic nucleotide-binding domain-containing protein n=1 Tax=Desulfovibrio sp. JC022 TaxID=2593642 RepID=UPI0013D11F60|nr:cyclic nucleotide-binding domain-containing protein [Desulfovibrio sp. JC022]NDV24205.1 cyclic nucleotide-binding domain-containing protein [Desulfovibrio sp. JC022]
MADYWQYIPLFQNLNEDELQQVKHIFASIAVRSGTDIISEGEEGDEMFILVDGKVRISKAMLMKGMTLPLSELKNPSKVLANLDDSSFPMFGEIALIDRDQRSATVTVVEDSEFLVTDRMKFFEFVGKHPAIGGKLLMTIGKRLTATVRRNNNELVKLTTALALALSRTNR